MKPPRVVAFGVRYPLMLQVECRDAGRMYVRR
jgi:hypothetical protein